MRDDNNNTYDTDMVLLIIGGRGYRGPLNADALIYSPTYRCYISYHLRTPKRAYVQSLLHTHPMLLSSLPSATPPTPVIPSSTSLWIQAFSSNPSARPSRLHIDQIMDSSKWTKLPAPDDTKRIVCVSS
jgi:hypothetical protein